ncbi:hypothetical protein JHK85_037144 [Glycine max]|nr:hypothetical protein JHK85_037144 [Glycine max]
MDRDPTVGLVITWRDLCLHVVRRVTSHFSINAEQLSSHSNNKSSSFQYLLSQSFSPEQKNAFDTLSSSAAINQTNVIAMSSQSSTGSSVRVGEEARWKGKMLE